MKVEYRDLLEGYLECLCKRMDPEKVLSRLKKSGVFQKYDEERVNHKITTQDKVSLIMEILMERSFEDLSKFLCILASIDSDHCDLALMVQPVNYRVAWFVPSPAHAAAVVYVLEKYAGAKFTKITRCGEMLAMRRARVFPREFGKDEEPDDQVMPDEDSLPVDVEAIVTSSHQTEVCLFFPTANSDVLVALETWFGEGLVTGSQLLLMSDIGGGPGAGRGRKGVIVTEVCTDGERVHAGVEDLKSLEDHLSRVLMEGGHEWMKEEWMKEECGSKCEPQVGFAKLPSEEGTDGDGSDQGAGPVPSAADSLAFKFYQLCQLKCPTQPSLLCQGIPPLLPAGEVTLGTKSAAAVTCSCFLLEVCRFYSPH